MDLPEWLEDERNRRLAVLLALVVAPIILGALIGTVLGSGTGGGNRVAVVSRLASIEADALVSAPDARPKELDQARGMGSEDAGIAITALSEVDSVVTSKGERRAPAGGSLIAFTLGDWTCENTPCESWRTLAPSIDRDGVELDLPAKGNTFVVAIPPGTADVELVIDDAGFTQKLSLLSDTAGEDNIALLARDDDPERRIEINKSYRLGESTSIQFTDSAGVSRNQFVRDVTIDYAQLRFFLDGATPSTPGRAFLVIGASYAYEPRPARYAFDPREVSFVTRDGRTYQAKDLDPSDDKALLGFEIPADIRNGTFIAGGTTEKTSTTGIPYTSIMQRLQLPLTWASKD